MKKILSKINEYQDIVIYRHVNPDYDAFGSQFGLYELLMNSFKEKNIYVVGKFESDLVDKFEFTGNYDLPSYKNDTLGIVLDTANRERIDGDYQQCKELIKIDHHIPVDPFGNINFEDSSASSCSQLIGQLYQENSDSLAMNVVSASCLYMGIVGDTGRFQYRSTDQRTFNIASLLMTFDIDISKIYQRMYMRKAKDLEVNRFIFNNYKVIGKVAYYILNTDDLVKLGISREEGSNYVNTLSNIEEYHVWMAITRNELDNNWRVSIRSREITINEIAAKFNGGGHALASGATLNDISQLSTLVSLINEAINNTNI